METVQTTSMIGDVVIFAGVPLTIWVMFFAAVFAPRRRPRA